MSIRTRFCDIYYTVHTLVAGSGVWWKTPACKLSVWRCVANAVKRLKEMAIWVIAVLMVDNDQV